jgi:CubicO group peptidase (beta-lactamase class C family)
MKNIPALFLLIATLTGTGCADMKDETYESPDGAMKAVLNTTPAPGAAAVIVSDGEIIWEGFYGETDRNKPVGPETLFMLASVSKTVTLTAMLHLWESGAYDLDDDISDYLGYRLIHPDFPDVPITFRMLMQHNASIHDRFLFYMSQYTVLDGGGDWQGDLETFLYSYFNPEGKNYRSRNFSKQRPGTEYEYSNLAVALLAVLLEKISGTEFPEYCRQEIFEPLKMDSSAWFLSDLEGKEDSIAKPRYLGKFRKHYGYPDYPAGQLRSNAADMGRFAAMWSGKGSLGDVRILTPETVELATELDDSGMGLIWNEVHIGIPGISGHSGGDLGIFTKIVIDTTNDTAFVLLTNGKANNDPIYADLYRLFLYSTTKYDGTIQPMQYGESD